LCARRNWFLERVLKLGLTQIAKEYQCVRYPWIPPVRLSEMCSVQPVPTLPPVPVFSRRSGVRLTTQSFVLVGSISSFRPLAFPYPPAGPCQPSMVYRYLRTLEGVTPPLSLTHLSCQITAKAFAATRMRALLFARSRSALTPNLPDSIRQNVFIGATWQRTQYDSVRSPERHNRSDWSEAPLPILYPETRNDPSHKAIKGDIDGHFLIKIGPTRWESSYQPYQGPLPSEPLTIT